MEDQKWSKVGLTFTKWQLELLMIILGDYIDGRFEKKPWCKRSYQKILDQIDKAHSDARDYFRSIKPSS